MNTIRNFSIIAHINHGKSTLSDRFIQICGGLSTREMKEQILDSMDLEREKGITIKSQIVTLDYKSIEGLIYKLNLIDTPGHVDFSYEVSRSLAACEGALLIIDAQQGIEAQTLAHCYKAIEMDIKILPVLNKIDLPNINIDSLYQKIENLLGMNKSNILKCSAKTGTGVKEVLESLVHNIPAPIGDPYAPLQALIIDSWFDNYLGVIILIRIKNGILKKGDIIQIMSRNKIYKVERLGVFTPKRVDQKILSCGEVGWLICNIKNILGAPVGDTVTLTSNPAKESLIGFKKTTPQIYASLFPIYSNQHKSLRDALDKLYLNDASLHYEAEISTALGFGFRCGFLGLLHMDVVQERLEREYHIRLIITTPTVLYEIITKNNSVIYINNPNKLLSLNTIKEVREPIAECHILLPQEYIGSIITLCCEKRGKQINMIFYDNKKYIKLIYEIPLAEIIIDFFDRLKSLSHGYASLQYEHKCFKNADILCIKILINNNHIDALTVFAHKGNIIYRAHQLVNKLKELIPRQQFDIAIQAMIGKHIVARSTIKQFRKNVLAKCHGGDISRKNKLLDKQKEGKKRMKYIGNIKIPQSVFLAMQNTSKT